MQDLKLAVLIDADNISPKYVKVILDEAASFGVAACKRIYGDWSDARLKSWKDVLLNNSIIPIQQYSYTTGKNATDSAMIIDAMDLLYAGNVDGFCIVSSDSDFTRLAARLREAGKLVIGMGESKALGPFVKACDQFKYLDLILEHGGSEDASADSTAAAEAAAQVGAGDDTAINRDSICRLVCDMIDEMDDGTGWVRTRPCSSAQQPSSCCACWQHITTGACRSLTTTTIRRLPPHCGTDNSEAGETMMTNKKLNYLEVGKEAAILTAAVAIIAAAVFFFLSPSHTSVSSISGLGIVLSNFIPLPLSAITMILNIVLLIIGFLTCGREFGAKTVYTSITLPLFLGLFEILFPDFESMTGSQELDVLCYILVVSIGLSILFNRNASSGGLDIVAKILNKYLRMDLGRAMSLSGMCVALSAALVYDKKTVVLSILGTYFNGIILDHFIFDHNKKRRVCIITEKEEALRQFIINELHSGATIYEAIGAYNLQRHNEIITIVDKSEYQKLMNFINREDPKAFITIYNVSNMQYQPKIWKK